VQESLQRRRNTLLQAIDDTTADKLWMLLAYKAKEDGVISDSKKVKESIGIINKQMRGRARTHANESTSTASSQSTSSLAIFIVKPNVLYNTMDK
jgi:hypothetical protein